MRLIWFLPSFDNAFYVFIILSLLVILINSRHEHTEVNLYGVLIISVCLLSILFNYIPEFYHPWQRLLIWTGVVFFVGPFINNRNLYNIRIKLFIYIQILNIIIIITSFLGKFIGISHSQGIYYSGIANHSILLGVVAANSLVFLTFLTISYFKTISNVKIISLVLMIFITFLMILAASSRSAFAAGLMGTIPVIWVFSSKGKSKASITLISIFFLLIIILSPIISDYSVGIQQKNHGQLALVDISSREKLWKESWALFKKNPFIGTGFSTFFDIDDNDLSQSGRVETGSSWLAVLSMTGIFGGLTILLIMIQSFLQLCNLYRHNNKYAPLLCGMIIFYIIHMCTEGYIFAGGSVLCMYFWLVLGTISAYNDLYSSDPSYLRLSS